MSEQKPIDWPQELVSELTRLGIECAELEAAAKLLEDSKHSVLCTIKLTFSTSEKSDAGRETLARATDQFKDYLVEMATAREKAAIARVKYDAQDMLCRLRQTQVSMRKARINAEMAHT